MASFRSLVMIGACATLAGCDGSPTEPASEVLFERPSTTGGVRVFQTEWADIIAADSAQARTAAMEVRAAAAALFTHFGVRPDRGCIRVINAGDTVPDCQVDLAWETPWMAPDFSMYMNSKPQALHGRLVNAGLQADTPVARFSHTLLNDRTMCRKRQAALNLATHLRHEFAHRFFIDLVWPKTGEELVYGGDAPDWLDEAAAMTADVPNLQRSRQFRFANMIAEGRVMPMAAFMSMEHPSMPEMRRMTSLARDLDQPQVTITRTNPDDPQQRISLDFYAQSQVVADFLISRTGDRRVLADLAASMRDGMKAEAWLSARLDYDQDSEFEQLEKAVILWALKQKWSPRREDQIVCGS